MVLLGAPSCTGPTREPGSPSSPLAYAPAPPDNPLKGLVPYVAASRAEVDAFPHSLEFSYLPLSSLLVGRGEFDWTPLEALLDEIAGRGHQAVFRVYLEYPHAPSGIPAYLLEGGLTLHRYTNDDVDPPAEVETPDYEDPELRAALVDFVDQLEARYDGDPRIGYITAGLLGAWGEWHTYPRWDLFASKTVQREILDAYERAFERTPILLRRPSGDEDGYARTTGRSFGYHDDSFAWATLDTGRPEDSWYFVPRLFAADETKAWKRHPIGGEIRPEAWGRVFDPAPPPPIQDFLTCVEATHVTWLMDSGMFGPDVPSERRTRAIDQVRRMGYELSVRDARLSVRGTRLDVRIELENLGVAPFYADWPAEIGLIDAGRRVVRRARAKTRIAGLLPGKTRVSTESLQLDGLLAGSYTIVLRVPNVLPDGAPVRFANRGQDLDLDGWMTLGEIDVDRP